MLKTIALINLCSACYQLGTGNAFRFWCALCVATSFFALSLFCAYVRRQTQD